jgi:hypothetical protein
MRTPQACAFFLGIVALAAAARAGESWRGKPYTEWNQGDVRQVLEDSPWAHRMSLIVAREQEEAPPVDTPASRGTSKDSTPLRGGNDPSHRTPAGPDDVPALNTSRAAEVTPPAQIGVPGIAVVRWASARTVREAMARSGELRGTLTEKQARELYGLETGDYFILYVDLRVILNDVSRVPKDGVLTSAMVQNSALVVRGTGERISPLTVKVAPLPEFDDRKELALASFYVFFPRHKQGKRVLRGDESLVRFECPLIPVAIHAEFDLRKMARDGSPDL